MTNSSRFNVKWAKMKIFFSWCMTTMITLQ